MRKPRWVSVTRWVVRDGKGLHITFPVTRMVNEGLIDEEGARRLAQMLVGPDQEMANLAAQIIIEKWPNLMKI